MANTLSSEAAAAGSEQDNALSMDESSTPVNLATESVPEEDLEKSTCIKALNDGHCTVKADLLHAISELSEKEEVLKELDEDAVRQREKTWLLEERIRLMTEKLCCLNMCLQRKEKKQETILKDLADTKWKIQEARHFLEKLKSSYSQMQSKKRQRQDEFAKMNSQAEVASRSRRELQMDIMRLTSYKMQLQRGEAQAFSILNGNMMMELEQRKQALREAIQERSVRSESLYVEIDEKAERVQRLEKSLENAKKKQDSFVRDRKNHISYLAETELRLQRSLDYLRSKIDFGTYIPPPWPTNIRETLRFKM